METFEDIKRQVIGLLVKYNIPYELWGKGTAKTLDHLVREVADGETKLVVEAGELVRTLTIVYIDVYHMDVGGETWKLVEERQVFRDGRERRRALEGSIAEKLKAAETPDQEMVHRALREELGIEGVAIARTGGAREHTQDSPSFPGLTMRAVHYYFVTKLDDAQFNPFGYVERQADKDTWFQWKKIASIPLIKHW